MRLFVAVTDDAWFEHLRTRPELDEVAFWQPGARRRFKTLEPGEPFLFKLHSPRHRIAGGGFFVCSTLLPGSLVWDAFGEKAGAASLEAMRRRIERARRAEPRRQADPAIGCIVLQEPFFLPESSWLPVPKDFSPNVGQGKTYRLTREPGRGLWRRLGAWLEGALGSEADEAQPELFGDPRPARLRLGIGGFRLLVLDAYERRCALTGEGSLPALEATHIRPVARGGAHRLDNGLLLRADLRRLFDLGYLTVTPDFKARVSRGLRELSSDGDLYAQLDGRKLRLPTRPAAQPSGELLAWHRKEVFQG